MQHQKCLMVCSFIKHNHVTATVERFHLLVNAELCRLVKRFFFFLNDDVKQKAGPPLYFSTVRQSRYSESQNPPQCFERPPSSSAHSLHAAVLRSRPVGKFLSSLDESINGKLICSLNVGMCHILTGMYIL